MRWDEVSEILEMAAGLDTEGLPMKDQIIAMEALAEFAEKLKPIVMRNTNKLPEKSTFLFKM